MWAHGEVLSGSNRCAICGCDNQNVLEDHHRIPSRHGGTDRDENIVTVCSNCHTALERIYNDAFWERVSALDFSEEGPRADKHQQNLKWNGKENEEKEGSSSEDTGRDLEKLASDLVSEGQVSQLETSRGDIDSDLISWKFDLNKKEGKILRKLIQREQNANHETDEIPKSARNEIIRSLDREGVKHNTLAAAFSVSRRRISQICSSHKSAGNAAELEGKNDR